MGKVPKSYQTELIAFPEEFFSRIASSLFLGDRPPVGWESQLRAGRGDSSKAEEAKGNIVRNSLMFLSLKLELYYYYCSDFKYAFSLLCIALFLPTVNFLSF